MLHIVANGSIVNPKCDCPAACNVTTYNADLSYAALSLDGIDSLLVDKRAAIQNKHVNAIALQHRVKQSSMTDILTKIRMIDKTVTKFAQFWSSKIERLESSHIFLVENAVAKIIDMANQDIKLLFQNITGYTIDYERHLAMERNWFDEIFAKMVQLMKDGYLPILHKWDKEINAEDMKTYLEALVQAVKLAQISITFLNDYGNLMTFKPVRMDYYSVNEYYIPSHAMIYKFPNGGYCSNANIEAKLQGFMSNHKNLIDEMSCVVNQSCLKSTGYRFYKELKSFESKEYIYSKLTFWQFCYKDISILLHEFSTFLTETNQWLDDNRMSQTSR